MPFVLKTPSGKKYVVKKKKPTPKQKVRVYRKTKTPNTKLTPETKKRLKKGKSKLG